VCARCGQDRPPAARWPDGPVCDTCYTLALRRRGACAACGQQRRLIAPPGPDPAQCADCAGLPLTHVCSLCGVEDKLFEKGRCARCSLRGRAAALLAGAGLEAVAGALLLLFGQHLSRIAVMTTGQITSRDDHVHVRFGKHEIPVPGSLGEILTDLIQADRSPTGIGSPAISPWLFPGGMPGQPITPSRLGERLRALGVRAMPGRRAALIDLAGHLPAAVLADALNLAPGTAVRWMQQAGADWNRYAADLARAHVITNPDE
jgi:hypothetical protein